MYVHMISTTLPAHERPRRPARASVTALLAGSAPRGGLFLDGRSGQITFWVIIADDEFQSFENVGCSVSTESIRG